MSFLTVYTIISVILAVSDIAVVFLTHQKKDGTARFLGMIGIFAAVVNLSYLLSLYQFSYFYTSLFSSIYFIGIDAMLVSLIAFLVRFTDLKRNHALRLFQNIIQYIFAFEILEFIINPFYEFSVGYDLANYSFIMGPLYHLHLVFTYTLVAVATMILIWQAVTVPTEYRKQFTSVIGALFFIVFINALFLFIPANGLLAHVDYSVCGYSIPIFTLYWSAYVYRSNNMLKGLSMTIFDNIDQGIILFDYNRNILMQNAKAKNLLAPISSSDIQTVGELTSRCGISPNFEELDDSFSLQCFLHNEAESTPLRCDCRKITGRKGKVTGYLFVFTDLALDIDLLTEFHNRESFIRFASDKPNYFSAPAIACACDINSLKKINSSYGHEEGDKAIRELADNMRAYLPEDSYFIRGRDARLIAVCYEDDIELIRSSMKRIAGELKYSIQFSVVALEDRHNSILDAIEEAEEAMTVRKLTDLESAHSQVLATLSRALEQTDSDTQSHVIRTQQSGAELGRLIGLTDLQQAQLSLLCLLHDIGKIGVPLEILNKPGKLNETEWAAMCSHVDKGYNIAVSSNELACIADMILHHHERWDGRGYPSRIKGEEIPLLSRIIAVIDAYDAMVHDRCYRKAIPVEQAKNELKHCAGTQFDPYIVEQFLKVLEKNSFVDSAPEKTDESRPALPVSDDNGISPIFNSHVVPYTRYYLDGDNYIIEVDEEFERVTGYSPADVKLLHMRQSDLLPAEDVLEYLKVVAEVIGKNGFGYLEHRLLSKDGSINRVLCYGRAYFDSSIKEKRSEILVTRIMGSNSVESILNEKIANDSELIKLKGQLQSDPLTSLLSHASFSDEISLAIEKDNHRILLLMLDIDNFIRYNEMQGLNAGDSLLVYTAQTLRSALRSTDLACRMGGDEFGLALFFDKHTPDTVLNDRAQQIFDKINIDISTKSKGFTVSMGAAFTCSGVDSFASLYQEAVHSLYVSKNSGKGRLTVAPGDIE